MTCQADERAVYHIRVQRRLGAEWSDRLGGMTMVVRDVSGLGAVTELTGPIADQAALMGVLEQLYSQGATLLAVERRDTETDGEEELNAGAGRQAERSEVSDKQRRKKVEDR